MNRPALDGDAYRDRDLVLATANQLRTEVNPSRSYRFMEFCGGHTHVVFRYGLRSLLPENIELVHGPGCPVCVLPRGRIDAAIQLTRSNPEITLCTYADLMRVPGAAGETLIRRRAQGASVKMVYSPRDALAIAEKDPSGPVVFLAIGFETTAPATALVALEAKRLAVKNFFVDCLHLLTPPAIAHVLEAPEVRALGTIGIDGFIGPGHVSAVIGTRPYEYFASEYQKPVVVSGFAPLDMLQSLLLLVRQVNRGEAFVENQYRRVVTREGNARAQAVVAEVCELRRVFEWRGLGHVPYSALRFRETFESMDAEKHFGLSATEVSDHPACLCGAIIRGVSKPTDCKLFGTACTPDNPVGSCMVSSEGTCAAYFTHAG